MVDPNMGASGSPSNKSYIASPQSATACLARHLDVCKNEAFVLDTQQKHNQNFSLSNQIRL